MCIWVSDGLEQVKLVWAVFIFIYLLFNSQGCPYKPGSNPEWIKIGPWLLSVIVVTAHISHTEFLHG